MAGARAPSGSLRNHASTASKASKGGVFGTQPSAPKLKPSTFVGSDDSDSDSDSSSSSSDSDGSEKKQVKQTPLPKQKADVAKATPAKSPTVNGLKASIKKEQPSKKIKKEATSSSESSETGSGSESESDSESDSASSSGEKPTKAPAKGEEVEKSTKPKPETKTAAANGSDSSSASESTDEKAKRPATKADKKKEAPPKSKAKAVKQVTPSESESESESSSQASSAESESESESESGSESEEDSEGSEDPEAQIQQQIRDDVKSAKATKAREPIPSSKAEVSNKKIKTSKDVDGDIEMTDPSTALTNGGAPTKVGSVPEFVAPDFHLRKVDGSIGASEVAGFFEKAKMEGKQVWYITAPASLPVTVVQDLTIPMDSAHKGLPVLAHNGDDYRLAFDDPSASSSFRLLIPNKKGQEYSELGRPVDQTMHFTRSETFLPEGPASVTTTQTVSKTTRPARPQPEGLRARYTPLGVPASKKPLAPIAGSEDNPVANVAAQEATAISTPKSSSKKKRKHDGENGPVATPATKDPSKSASAEKSVKKQKIIRDHEHTADGQAGRKETPIPLPPLLGVGSSSVTNSSRQRATSAAPTATQPTPVHRQSDSPGGRLSSTQVPSKQTPIPIPVPVKANSAVGTPDAKAREGKERKEKKRSKSQLPSIDKAAERFGEVAAAKSPEKSAKSPEKSARTPKKNTPILPPRHDSRGKST
ncbi:hypothetical protein SLS63_003373 [Diaporthe eres]|uniref:DNA-directed RNA polymerase I subunit n=1 Tax=Diaporthe eres TaxID=83184 RepID=A0ABR1PGQ6_DIAER